MQSYFDIRIVLFKHMKMEVKLSLLKKENTLLGLTTFWVVLKLKLILAVLIKWPKVFGSFMMNFIIGNPVFSKFTEKCIICLACWSTCKTFFYLYLLH